MSKAEGFAAIPNWMIRDRSISPRNIIVYASLASRSGLGGIHPSQATLADETGLTERTVRTALRELEELGVIERVRRTAKTRGQSNRLPDGYVLHPNGKLPADFAGRSKLPAKKDEATGKNEHSTLLIEVEPVEVDSAKPSFAEFYLAYPRKVGKEAARRAFEKAAKLTDSEVIVAGARRYAADPNLPDKQFIPHPSTWLSEGRWDDEPEAPRARVIHAPSIADFADGDEWMAFNR